MTIDLKIRPSIKSDIYDLANHLRIKDADELVAMGYKPRSGVYYSFKQGVYRKTGFVNDKIAAMWGVCGAPIGLIGQPYLLTTKAFETLPTKQIVQIYRQEVQIMLQIFPVLENYVDFNYTEAVKLLMMCGFTIDPPIQLGPRYQMFHKYHIGQA